MLASAAMLTLGLASPALAQFHGVSVQKNCVGPKCVGSLLDCTIRISNFDEFGDTIEVLEGFDNVNGTRVPAVGNLPIIAVAGNVLCTGGAVPAATFPCYIGAPNTTLMTPLGALPGSASAGSVTIRNNQYLITGADPDPLPNTGTFMVRDRCDSPTTSGCNNTIVPATFVASTDLIHPDLTMTETALPASFCQPPAGQTVPVTFTYKVCRNGDVNLTNVVVTPAAGTPMCGMLVRGLDDPGNNDNTLEANECWTFSRTCNLSASVTDTATVTATSPDCNANGNSQANVTVTPGPTCTITTVCPINHTACPGSGTIAATVTNDVAGVTKVWSVDNPGVCSISNQVDGAGTSQIDYSISAPGPCIFKLTVANTPAGCPPSDCTCTVNCAPAGGQGRTPGFWKQEHHFGHWPAPYCAKNQPACPCGPATKFCDIFNCAAAGSGCDNEENGVNAAYGNKTLLQVLNQGGGGFYALGRHAVAALLNSAHPQVDYAFDTALVISKVNMAIANCNPGPTKNELAAENELEGGPLGGQCYCANPCPGAGQGAAMNADLTGDGKVNMADLHYLLSKWGTRDHLADLDRNGKVGSNDMTILMSWWTQ